MLLLLLLHPVPSCCLAEAEAASQTAERKESCASRQEIEPGLARRGCKGPQLLVPRSNKREQAQSGHGSVVV